MVGERSGVATRLKSDERIQSLISVHYVCHKLALACTYSLNDPSVIKQMQNTLTTPGDCWIIQTRKLPFFPIRILGRR